MGSNRIAYVNERSLDHILSFSLDGTEVAAGGLISNIARVISILLAVGLTIWHKKKNETKIFSYPVWEF